jgi:translation initiation factor IF-2
VVTILGHVDHGKTSLLDNIRNTNVADGEAGGITQTTSAFRVPVKAGDGERMVTFIDTPGHEAFTEMRARGAKVTDIVVLVIAVDDGVMPQTIESIAHAKAAGVPIVVALNKIDKAEATDENIQRILGQLAEHELNPVDWGGDTEVIRTSAIKNEGIQDLLDILDYQAELLDLKADFGGPAEGTVIEAHLAEGYGPVASILVQQGSLKKGDYIVAGRSYGRLRSLTNDRGEQVDSASPSMPMSISGLSEVPDAGDKFYIVKSQKEAEAAAKERILIERQKDLSRDKITLDNIFEQMKSAEIRELPVIIKGDVQGSIETLRSTIAKIGNDEARISIKHAAVGGINESDINLAGTCSGIVVGFNATSTPKSRRLAEQKGVEIRYYDVIYDLTDDLTKALEGLLDPEIRLEVLGHAEVRDVFKISKVGMIAGCYVTDGTIERNQQIRVTRDGIVIESDRHLEQLKRFKDDAKEVKSGQECGMKIDGYDDIKVGDVIECYKTLEVERTL